jgi:aspartyl/asparaginyl-tRNA synthetase
MIRTPRILVADLHSHVGETICIAGWAQTLRLQRAVQFVIVRDHSCAVQITHRRDGTALEESLEGLSVESAVRLTGRVVANPLAWIDGVEDVMDFEERMLAHVLAEVAAAHGPAIKEHFGVDVLVPSVPFPRITMAEALRIGGAGGGDSSRADLDPAGERAVAAWIRERTGHEFAFVTEYPASVRPFYHLRPAGQPQLTASFDLLWKGLEITTGAQREHRHDVLVAQAAEKGLSPFSELNEASFLGVSGCVFDGGNELLDAAVVESGERVAEVDGCAAGDAGGEPEGPLFSS